MRSFGRQALWQAACVEMESLKDASGRVQECLARPALCDLRAEAVRDPTARATFAESAQCWREMAWCWRGLARR